MNLCEMLVSFIPFTDTQKGFNPRTRAGCDRIHKKVNYINNLIPLFCEYNNKIIKIYAESFKNTIKHF